MKRKKRAATGKIYKYKARLNVGGHKQEKDANYWQTYSQVTGWPIVRLFLTLTRKQTLRRQCTWIYREVLKHRGETKITVLN